MTPPTPIRGRPLEVDQIRTMIAALARGVGGVLFIEGPPGIGKSRLLSEAAALAVKAGVRPLFGEAFEYQQSVPFAPLFMATLRADPPIGDAESFRRLGSDADLRYCVVHDLQAAISAQAAHQPLILILDDIHWADNATLSALRSLVAGLTDVPVLWMLAARTGAGGSALREALAWLECADAQVVRLNAIPPGAAVDIVSDVIKANPDASLRTMVERAHGNPFLLMELVQGLQEEDRISVEGGRAVATGQLLPQRLTQTMRQRLDRLSDAAREVVQVAAVLPDRFSGGLLAAMLERQPVALVAAVDEAVRADLLVDVDAHLRFRHDLLRQAARQSMPESLRRAMEREVGTTLLEQGAAPEEVATLLARSAELGDLVAVAALRNAARSAAWGDVGTAAELSKRALELMPVHDPERSALVAETVVLLNRAMRYDEAEQLAGATLSSELSAEQEARVRLSLSMTAWALTAQQRAEENRRALQLSPLHELTRARHQAWLAYHLVTNGQSGLAGPATNEASASAQSTGDLETMVLAEVTRAYLDCVAGYGQRAVSRLEELDAAIRGADLPQAVHQLAAFHRANLLIVTGRLEDAAAISTGMQATGNERGRVAVTIWAQLDGLVHLAAGRLTAARTATEKIDPQDRMAWTAVGGVVGLLTLADVAVRTDDRSLLRQAVIQAHAAYSDGPPAMAGVARQVLALAAWRHADLHGAVRWLAGDGALLETPVWPLDLDHLTLAARVAAAAGDAGLRARVVQAVDTLGRERPSVPLFTSIAQQARGILERDAEALLAAAALLETSGRPLLYAAAREDAGNELGRTQRIAEAVDQLHHAFDTYLACEAIGDAHRVSRALRCHGVTRRVVTPARTKEGWDSLTESELRVVYLVADGATNQDAAKQLHLSPHTVNTHVRNAFVKLGINSRNQLKGFLH